MWYLIWRLFVILLNLIQNFPFTLDKLQSFKILVKFIQNYETIYKKHSKSIKI